MTNPTEKNSGFCSGTFGIGNTYVCIFSKEWPHVNWILNQVLKGIVQPKMS